MVNLYTLVVRRFPALTIVCVVFVGTDGKQT